MCVPPWVARAFADQARVRAAEQRAARVVRPVLTIHPLDTIPPLDRVKETIPR